MSEQEQNPMPAEEIQAWKKTLSEATGGTHKEAELDLFGFNINPNKDFLTRSDEDAIIEVELAENAVQTAAYVVVGNKRYMLRNLTKLSVEYVAEDNFPSCKFELLGVKVINKQNETKNNIDSLIDSPCNSNSCACGKAD